MVEVHVIDVEVAYAEADKQVIVPLQVPVGTSAGEAVRRSGLAELRVPAAAAAE